MRILPPAETWALVLVLLAATAAAITLVAAIRERRIR